MNIRLPKGTRQREALIVAVHGDVALTKGLKPQIKALVKAGFLDEDLRPTADGSAAYAEFTRVLTWGEALKVLDDGRRYSSQSAPFEDRVTALSADGATAYIAQRRSGPVVAIDVTSIPDAFLGEFGLVREPFLSTIVTAS